MKLDTQRDRWQAVLDGYTIKDENGVLYGMPEDSLLVSYDGERWDDSEEEDLAYVGNGWQLYEPPKPENKVIVIKKRVSETKYRVLDGYYSTENDAIRAAMEWIGEKAKRVKISTPEWFVLDDETYCSRLGRWGATELKGLELALLMRWPIEVIEEV